MHQKTTTLLGVLGTVALAAAGCRDNSLGAPASDAAVVLPPGSVQAAVLEDTTARDGTVTYIVRVLARDVTVSSYQGTVSFAPGAFTLVSTSTPTGQGGESYVLNPSGFADGRIRFAALTPTKFGGAATGDGAEAFRFTVRTLNPAAQSGVKATLEVVGTDIGKAVSAERVLPSPGVLKLASPRK